MENRLGTIYQASSFLFINRGYARTQMKDIAKEIGLSTGMLYVYFKGKREILDFLLKCTIDPTFISRNFDAPIDGQTFIGLWDEIISCFTEIQLKFAAPLLCGAQDYTLEQMFSDAFDTIARYGTGCLVIEKNIRDVGALGTYYLRYRKQFFEQILNYIHLYLFRGEMRQVPYPEWTAQQVIEILAWWGMHVQNDAFEPHQDISTALAKEICMDNLIHAYKKVP